MSVGYYLSAVDKGGEPAGTWIGSGAAGLGFIPSTSSGATARPATSASSLAGGPATLRA